MSEDQPWARYRQTVGNRGDAVKLTCGNTKKRKDRNELRIIKTKWFPFV